MAQNWTEARDQIWSASGLMGALVGNSHPVILAYGRLFCMYERMQTRLERELDHAHGQRLRPALIIITPSWRG
jgi:hypothetical protein